MLPFDKAMKETPKNEFEKCLDSQLWHACAGGMVQMPQVNSVVYYFPQGHAEHAQNVVDFSSSPRIPALILCRVTSVKFMADPDSDELFAKLRMVPVQTSELDYVYENCLGLDIKGVDAQEKPASFAKTLTQSDANNGGGFSVPRYCAETIFPPLDYSIEPPVQTVLARDVHGEVWKFRHIYRGTPRRHLLTTGWSAFVNQKKLVAGDSIVFLRARNGELCVGIRRAKRGGIGGGNETLIGWNAPGRSFGSFSFLRKESGNRDNSTMSSNGCVRESGRFRKNDVVEAAKLAASGQPFEVVYYPRASTPEFCVKATAVKAAMRIQWCPGMRFKMPFETEDSSRISWFLGTIASVQVVDPIRWPNSPWKVLQVTWDEPDLLQNVKRISPWLVELVSNVPSIHLEPFSSPRKKLCLPPQYHFSLEGHLPTPMFPGHPLGPSSSFRYFSESTPAGIQGARHAKFGASLSDVHLSKLQTGLSPAAFHRLHHVSPTLRTATNISVDNHSVCDNVSGLLTISCHNRSQKTCHGKPSKLILFGKTILTEEQMSQSNSSDPISPWATGKNFSAENIGKETNVSSGYDSAISQSGIFDNSLSKRCCEIQQTTELVLETGHCKVFVELDGVGRSLDLSACTSFDDLYETLANMFENKETELMSRVLYKDSTGVVKHIGDEPFSDFMKNTRRLTILTNAGSNGIAGKFSSQLYT